MKFGLTLKQVRIVKGQRRLGTAFDIMLHVAKTGPSGATCDDCSIALGLKHQTASARFHELVQAGCIVTTKNRRKTTSGRLATVYVVPKGASFLPLLALTRVPKPTPKPGLTTAEQAVLAAGLKFLKQWGSSQTPKQRQSAIVSLVTNLRRTQPLFHT